MTAYPKRSRARRHRASFLSGVLAASVGVALTFAGMTFGSAGDQAAADPASAPGITTISSVGAYSGTVPSGVCTVTAQVLGGAGGSAVTTTSDANGAGAQVTATYAVVPGQTYSGTVGGGGQQPTGSNDASTQGAGGSNGGGDGGYSGLTSNVRHHGAGGGGYTDLQLGGTLAILAGGGGGAGGGHSISTDGRGGTAGLPAAPGVAPGSDGYAGRDTPAGTVTGGIGGSGVPGAGGTNSNSASVDGLAGSGRTGGAGGADPNPDAGGGGGGGYAGGGGGASTVGYNTQNGSSEIAGAGGGGGSSYVAATIPLGLGTTTPTGISSIAGATLPSAGNGAAGSVRLTWNACEYDLAVVKSVSHASPPTNSTVTWTVEITNNGTAAMTQGDTVTLTDTLPGSGTKTIFSIATSGGSNDTLVRGAVTCSAAVGAVMPGTLTCSRPYQVDGDAVSGVRGLDVGETLTVRYTQAVTEATGTTLTNTASVTDRVTGDTNDSSSASATVVDGFAAVDDVRSGFAIGTTVDVAVTGNDTGDLVPGSVTLWDPGAGTPISGPHYVTGQGTWTVASDIVTFTPEAGFVTDPDPVFYRVQDTAGDFATAQVTVTYVPSAMDDSDLDNLLGTTINVEVLDNDTGSFVLTSVRIVTPGGPVLELIVAGEGRWLANSDGTITFFPESGFLLDPAPVDYQVTDVTGDTVSAILTITYLPTVIADQEDGNTIGAPVVVRVLVNDTGDFDLSSLQLIDPATSAGVATLTMPGEGAWTVDTALSELTFTPEADYVGNPTPVRYRITDSTGDTVSALVTVTYLPVAVDDDSFDNAGGTNVTVPILINDMGVLDTSTPRLMAVGVPTMSMTVAGEGRWVVSTASSSVTFQPLASFRGNPTPVPYRVADVNGNLATASVTITYLTPLALTGASVEVPFFAGLAAIVMGIGALLASRLRRVARHRY